ncbi:PREDICTED: probable leucine-rich repeat receptor-like protein kinase At5g49770 [Nelumbo nucifera]|uniref:non-specific serine/threonine protein kinase n=2 Tax=Nelumbo nucifera TaxID=4432 RepID=A0A1U7ZUX9_NELNU|nr:PREDICTED: probable leucine-rich repeat receptor-like protein kinase At5g49770 [Nelumbo nucifera]DAD38790.1 TPA_asm: hypothetical protein HUJ06_013112 [Nelumbo nucifera]
MNHRIQACLLVLCPISILAVQAISPDAGPLYSLRSLWPKTPTSWDNPDPCNGWVGIICNNEFRVISIKLSSLGLKGQLPGDIGSLTQLQILDMSYNKGLNGPISGAIAGLTNLTNLILIGCSFSGVIPDNIGSLQQLVILSLNFNSFSGTIPSSIGKLSKLYWLDLADNKLTGTIPVSSGNQPGLDMLTHTKHFHFGKNQLGGEIPAQLFRENMSLIHVIFDNNKFTGPIPSTIGLLNKLQVLRLDRNLLSGHVPSSLNDLTDLQQLQLSNNQLTGPMPDLSGMKNLNYVDFSNNTFEASDVPQWFSTLKVLTTLIMDNTQLQGSLTSALFSLPQLQSVNLKNNQINGTLDLGYNYSAALQIVDVQNNQIMSVQGHEYHKKLLLDGNPFCSRNTGADPLNYCTNQEQSIPPYSTSKKNCGADSCPSDQVSSPNCKCSYPYMGTLYFRAPLFSWVGNMTYYYELEKTLTGSFKKLQLPVDSVFLSNPRKSSDNYLELDLQVFPYGTERFNFSGLSSVGFVLGNQTIKPPPSFGPFFFIGSEYKAFAESSPTSKKSMSLGVIIGAAVGVFVLVLALLCAGYYAFRQKRRADRITEQSKAFSSCDASSSGSIPQLKGARWFSFNELKKCTNNFSEANVIGSGGYGKVYKGTLSATGQLVAIKRAQRGSMQGNVEFKTEIELLSRVHHKNLVTLVGFCFEKDEQMLVYEYVPNGTLKESISGKSGVRLDWTRRLRVALGSARGLAYLHEHANPPIIHRDIKSTNILLDERLNAKVADFGLSKLMADNEKDHVSTQVKGTMGYMDPEYYTSQMLTEKSDVYSFGVLMLELITGRRPIERGRYIVREVRVKMDKTKDLYGLDELLDPVIVLGTSLKGLEKFVDLAMRCVEELGSDRPMMSEVVKEIESILQLAGLNPNVDSASTSESYVGSSGSHTQHPNSDSKEFFDDSGGYPPCKVEAQ